MTCNVPLSVTCSESVLSVCLSLPLSLSLSLDFLSSSSAGVAVLSFHFFFVFPLTKNRCHFYPPFLLSLASYPPSFTSRSGFRLFSFFFFFFSFFLSPVHTSIAFIFTLTHEQEYQFPMLHWMLRPFFIRSFELLLLSSCLFLFSFSFASWVTSIYSDYWVLSLDVSQSKCSFHLLFFLPLSCTLSMSSSRTWLFLTIQCYFNHRERKRVCVCERERENESRKEWMKLFHFAHCLSIIV